MARRSKIAAQRRREQAVAHYAERRAAIKHRVKTSSSGSPELAAAVAALVALPRDSSPVRLRNRDQIDGRPRGYVRKTGTSRIRFRELAHHGNLPGIRKASW
ncbi:MAG: 30S ribosomal protein S14 [Nocardioides sp.]